MYHEKDWFSHPGFISQNWVAKRSIRIMKNYRMGKKGPCMWHAGLLEEIACKIAMSFLKYIVRVFCPRQDKWSFPLLLKIKNVYTVLSLHSFRINGNVIVLFLIQFKMKIMRGFGSTTTKSLQPKSLFLSHPNSNRDHVFVWIQLFKSWLTLTQGHILIYNLVSTL